MTASRPSISFAYSHFDALPMGILIYRLEDMNDDYSLRLIASNQAASKMAGTDLSPLVGLPVAQAFPELFTTGLPSRYARVARTQTPEDCGEVRYGDQRVPSAIFSVRAFPLPDQCVGVAFDNVTEKWQARQAQMESEGFLQQIINSVADPIFVKDHNHRLVLINDAMCRLIGRERGELMGKSDHDLFPAAEADVFHDRDERVFESGQENTNEEIITDAQGVKHTIATKKMLYTDMLGRPHIVGVIRDITDQKRIEEELRNLNSTLEARVSERTAAYNEQTRDLAKSNAELERFAYVASHDLQEPLRMVGSYVQLLARRYQGKLGSDADEFITFVVDGVARMKSLINDLLEYSRLGRRQHTYKPIGVQDVLKEVVGTLKMSIQECKATVTWTDLPTVASEALSLAQVFQNLIGNAIKFRAEHPPRIHIAAQQSDGVWVFSVADNGIGIDSKHRERIFDVFQRLHTSDKYPGTGIGLAICKKIVEHHGGRIWVEGEPGKGSTFFFTLAPAQIKEQAA